MDRRRCVGAVHAVLCACMGCSNTGQVVSSEQGDRQLAGAMLEPPAAPGRDEARRPPSAVPESRAPLSETTSAALQEVSPGVALESAAAPSPGGSSSGHEAMRPVSVKFEAIVGAAPFACGRRYPRVGATGVCAEPLDLRVLIHDLRLIDANGRAVPVVLDERLPWQSDQVALVDFEDGSGQCSAGTPGSNAEITGLIPPGHYQGLSFRLGVQEELNHGDPTERRAPLQLGAMHWGWLLGYKFLVAELREVPEAECAVPLDAGVGATQSKAPDSGASLADSRADTDATAPVDAAAGAPRVDAGAAQGGTFEPDGGLALLAGDAGRLGDARSSAGGAAGASASDELLTPAPPTPVGIALLHLGSTGCERDSARVTRCAVSNRPRVVLPAFDADSQRVVVDVGALFADSDLKAEAQCHSSSAACEPMFARLGLPQSAAPEGGIPSLSGVFFAR